MSWPGETPRLPSVLTFPPAARLFGDRFDFRVPDYSTEIARRGASYNSIVQDDRLLAAVKLANGRDPVTFVQNWLWTYDPRRQPATIPFRLFPRQREFLRWLQARMIAGEDGLVEKSRDMGMTWLCMAFAVWGWLHIPGFKAGFGSRKEDLVDRIGDMDSIFEKGRFMLRLLPDEFLPDGFSIREHTGHLKFINPATGAGITGEAGDNIGRGGRNSIYFKDESAFYERPESIDAALSENCPCKIDVSTPNGAGNPFHSKRITYPEHRVFVYDWRSDPRKDADWYQSRCENLEPWIVAQEIDHDYNASTEGICVPSVWVQAAVGLELAPSGAVCCGLDVADEGGDSNCIVIRRGPVVLAIEAWKLGDTTVTARRAWALAGAARAEWIAYDNIGVGAGVKGEMNSLLTKAGKAGGGAIHVAGINVGGTALEGVYESGKPNRDMFLNLKALLWWQIRRRFERTHEHVKGIKDWPEEMLISLPNNLQLVSELSRPKWGTNDAGKIKIESKEAMKRRGVKSPNVADALMLAFTPMEYIRYKALGGNLLRGAVGGEVVG